MKNYGTIRVSVTPIADNEKECMSSDELTERHNIPEFLEKYIRTSSEESCLYSIEPCLHWIRNPDGGTIDVENIWIEKTGEVFIPGTGVQKASDGNISGSPIFSAIVEMREDDFNAYKSLIEKGGDYSVRKLPA